MRSGEGITNRSREKIENEKHDHAGGQAGDKTAWERVGKIREIEMADVIANVWCHAAGYERGEVERPRTKPPQRKNCCRMG